MNTVFYASYFLLDQSPKLIRNVACSQQEHQKKVSGVLCDLLATDSY